MTYEDCEVLVAAYRTAIEIGRVMTKDGPVTIQQIDAVIDPLGAFITAMVYEGLERK